MQKYFGGHWLLVAGLGVFLAALLRLGFTPVNSQCHSAYPDHCFPASPDLDCDDIEARWFRVLPPDPHQFDRDQNGMGCEG